MSRLQSAPPSPVRSMAELFAIAQAMEAEAVAYYAEMAAMMRGRDAEALALVFDRLAAVERGHVDQVVAWSRHDRGEVPQPARLPWPVPETFDAPAAEAARSHLITPYRALAAAVRQEERAFAFWTYVAAHAGNDEIRSAAERMAHEELEHVAILRRERRGAYHAERGTRTSARTIRLSELAERERRIAAMLAATSAETGPAPDRIAALADAAQAAGARLDRLATTSDPGEPVATLAADTAASAEADLLACAELLVDAYLAAAEQATDSTVVSVMQDLAGMAVARLATLHEGRAAEA